jgi:two-component system, NarL family, nitrate/nitrite response regulator NarL
MDEPIRVAILDDHQAIIDGYLFRLSNAPDIKVVETLTYGEELEVALSRQPVDVLILDVQVPISAENPSSYPILYLIPRVIDQYPELAVLVISMHDQRTLVRTIMEAGSSGYILKDDRAAMIDLPAIIRLVQSGGFYISQRVAKSLRDHEKSDPLLTPRQVEVLSFCAAYPAVSTAQLAEKLEVAPSTVRNLLSSAYLKLGVPNRTAAIVKARQLGLIVGA